MTTATNPDYTDVVQKIGQMLFQALWEQEPDKDKKVRELDNIINKPLRRIGFLVVSLLLAELARLVTKKATFLHGIHIHCWERPVIDLYCSLKEDFLFSGCEWFQG